MPARHPLTPTEAMKVFVIYDVESAPKELHHRLAITLPSKWLDQSVDKVKEAFINAYNKKFPDNPLDDEELILSVKDKSPYAMREFKVLGTSDTPSKVFEDRGEVRVMPPPPQAPPPGMTASGKLKCKNYGCQCEFDEANNPESACRHHTAPPIFHDTRKWWSCCEATKVLDFDDLLKIPGCQTGKHSNLPPAQEVKRAADVAAATQKMMAVHTSAAKPSGDGKAPVPQQSFAPSVAPAPRKPKLNLPEGVARCKHYGCQQDYKIAENGPHACIYHKQAPIFHEGSKKWACCGVSRWDFDEFIAVPGCARGEHEPVV